MKKRRQWWNSYLHLVRQSISALLPRVTLARVSKMIDSFWRHSNMQMSISTWWPTKTWSHWRIKRSSEGFSMAVFWVSTQPWTSEMTSVYCSGIRRECTVRPLITWSRWLPTKGSSSVSKSWRRFKKLDGRWFPTTHTSTISCLKWATLILGQSWSRRQITRKTSWT